MARSGSPLVHFNFAPKSSKTIRAKPVPRPAGHMREKAEADSGASGLKRQRVLKTRLGFYCLTKASFCRYKSICLKGATSNIQTCCLGVSGRALNLETKLNPVEASHHVDSQQPQKHTIEKQIEVVI